jgi:hypothetical protein
LFGAIKEGLAPSQAIIEAGSTNTNPLVASVVASIKEMAAKREMLKPPVTLAGKQPEEVRTEVMAQLGKIPALLLADQAEGFKSWLVAIAGKVASMATEGGSLDLAERRSARQKQPPLMT